MKYIKNKIDIEDFRDEHNQFDFKSFFEKQISNEIEERKKSYQNIIQKTLPLAIEGWFISGYFDLVEILDFGVECDILSLEELNKYVMAMYKRDIYIHATALQYDYSNRWFAINSAIKAHGRGEYVLSIPTFFSQADGIVYDALGKELFSEKHNNKGDPRFRTSASNRVKLLNEANDAGTLAILLSVMWKPFSETIPIAYSESKRKEFSYKGLNRNTFMHGRFIEEDATEENSLKAFSLLSSVSCLMKNIKQDEKNYPWFSGI